MASLPISSVFSLVIALLLLRSVCFAVEVSFDNRALTINGQRKIILSGSIHYPRSTPGMWPSLIRKSKEGGLNTIETYVFWNAHEPQYRQYDFKGNLDLARFIKNIRDEGLYSILRIGPYVCAEWNYGGFPVWLKNLPGVSFRTNNEVYKHEMQTFTTLIVDMMKRENLFASQGGPIILAQIENEYGNVEWAYGNDGYEYLKWCAGLAQGYKIGIPWIMCQQDNAPWPMLSTCNGYYCDQWNPQNGNIPKMWTENWTGWYMDWGNRTPRRTAEDLAFAVARFFQLGGTLQNYYMYHGGTNFDRTAGGPYITTSYDYDAPLDEYGNLRQPKWGHLRDLHRALYQMEETLTYGDRSSTDYQGGKWVTMFSYQGKRSCFFSNADEYNGQTIRFEGTDYFLPAWSVSLLPDCYTEVFNTAKVNAPTAIMEPKPNEADDYEEPYRLAWQWWKEKIRYVNSDGSFRYLSRVDNNLLDQKVLTNGSTDYVWVMTIYDHNASDPLWGEDKDTFLNVHTNGHVLHAFANGLYLGSQSGYKFNFEKKIKLRNGINKISFVSATVGLPNYGPHFEDAEVGINGPVKLIARSKTGNRVDITKDISKNRWVYKNGLSGIDSLFGSKSHHAHPWYIDNRPSNRPFIWYKTTFPAPMGSQPVVVDLYGLGKGVAWINGHNIGRYWTQYHASEEGCDIYCDYRGTYGPNKCNIGCGKPSQRYYHIPRDWLKGDNNELVLFEELGGTPELVSIQTISVGKICGHAYEGKTLELSCQGGKISRITFASFGSPEGSCGSFSFGKCHSNNAQSIVEQACLGNESCSLQVSEDTFGSQHCRADSYRLAVEAIC